MPEIRQQDLGAVFAEADAAEAAARAENRAYLIGALARVRASSDLRIFVNAVFRHAGDNVGKRWWSVTIRQVCGVDSVAATLIDPLTEILGCSYAQAKRVAGRARSLGLVRTRPKHLSASSAATDDDERQPGQQWEYQVDWPGVRRLVGLDARAQGEPSRAQGEPSRAQGEPSRAQGEPAPYKEYTGTGTGPCSKEISLPRTGTGTGAAQPRLLDAVTIGTLGDTGELLALYERVCELSPVQGLTDCENDQRFVVAAAVHTLRITAARQHTREPLQSPVGYFRWIVCGNRRSHPAASDVDAANERYEAWKAKARKEQTCPT